MTLIELLVSAGGVTLIEISRRTLRYVGAPARRRRALLRAPIWRIGELPEDTIGCVIGTARPVGPALKAPLTGRDCVCYVVTVTYDQFFLDRVLIREQRGVTFVLEDDSGRAIVDPDGAELDRKGGYEESWGFLSKPTPLARAFMENRGVQRQGWAFDRDLSFHEEIVAVGETICVAGPGVREVDQDAKVGEGYRTAPPTRMRFMSSPKFELLLTEAPPAE